MPIETQSPEAPVVASRYSMRESLAPGSEELGFYHSVELLWDQRRLLVRWILAGAVLAVVLAVLLPSKYESTARMLPSENSTEAAMMMAGGGAAGAAMPNLGMMSDLLGMKTPGALCAAILVTRRQHLPHRIVRVDDGRFRRVCIDRQVHILRRS